MGLILTQDDLKREVQIERCKAAVEEYFKAQQISVDYRALYAKLEPYPLLFQFAHLIAFLKVDWRGALQWCHDHRGEILKHAEDSDAARSSDGAANRDDAIPTHKG